MSKWKCDICGYGEQSDHTNCAIVRSNNGLDDCIDRLSDKIQELIDVINNKL